MPLSEFACPDGCAVHAARINCPFSIRLREQKKTIAGQRQPFGDLHGPHRTSR